MKSIAVMKPNELAVVDIPMPKYDDCQALVKTLASGICGSDRKIMHGTFKNIEEYPTLLGHEAVAEVVEIGKNVENFKVGDWVLIPYHSDDESGYQSAWGAFSEYGIVNDWKAMAKQGRGPDTPDFPDFIYTQRVIPKTIDPVAAVQMITLREVLAASKHFGFGTGKSIAIFGAGPVGLTFIKFAKVFGVSPVIVIDVVDEKIAEAKEFGADYAINSAKEDAVAAVRKICPDGVDMMLDAVGINSLILTGMEMIKDNGKILVYGVSPELKMELDWSKAPYNWGLEFFQFPIKYDEGAVHEQLLSLMQLGVIDPMDFVSDVFDFADWEKAFELFESKKPNKKIVIKY